MLLLLVLVAACDRAAVRETTSTTMYDASTDSAMRVAGPAPAGISAELMADSTVSAARAGTDSAGLCAPQMRDPRHGTRFVLTHSITLTRNEVPGPNATITRHQAWGDYAEGTLPGKVLSAGARIRVDCVTRRVLGLSPADAPGAMPAGAPPA